MADEKEPFIITEEMLWVGTAEGRAMMARLHAALDENAKLEAEIEKLKEEKREDAEKWTPYPNTKAQLQEAIDACYELGTEAQDFKLKRTELANAIDKILGTIEDLPEYPHRQQEDEEDEDEEDEEDDDD